jgi:hypothetical protein
MVGEAAGRVVGNKDVSNIKKQDLEDGGIKGHGGLCYRERPEIWVLNFSLVSRTGKLVVSNFIPVDTAA